MSDGTQIHLHPDFTTKKVPAFIGPAAKDLSHPSTGLGGSDGPGTFRSYKNKRIEQWLQFGTPLNTPRPTPGKEPAAVADAIAEASTPTAPSENAASPPTHDTDEEIETAVADIMLETGSVAASTVVSASWPHL